VAFVPLVNNHLIRILDSTTGAEFGVQSPFVGFMGPISVKLGDVNGDGFIDLIVAAGSSGGPRIVVLDGRTGYQTPLTDFMAFDAAFCGGVNVAVGDVNGDGVLDIVVGAGPGGGPHVKVFSFANNNLVTVIEFMAYDHRFSGGVNVAVGDVNGDGKADIITGAGVGGGPHVKAFDGSSQATLLSFFAYGWNQAFGVNVAAGDVTGDGIVDIITAPEFGGGPLVRVFRGRDAILQSEFFAYEAGFLGGVNVGVGRVPGFNRLAVLTGPGLSGGAHVRGLDGLNGVAVFDEFLIDSSIRTGANVS